MLKGKNNMTIALLILAVLLFALLIREDLEYGTLK
jgi:hypothetical protein